ncbi:MAG: ABC transporter permease subunit [Lachnospiraceae bacterium]|nr:ABC transporter permease subunit [Lachnospiraceae bacterium]
MKNIKIIMGKELKRVFGDKKLIFSLFILPAILVIGIYSIMGMMISNVSSDIEEHKSRVYIVNASDSVKSIIDANGFSKVADIAYYTEDDFNKNADVIHNEILEETADLFVYFDKDMETKIAAYKNQGDEIPVMKYGYNKTSNYSGAAYSNFNEMVKNPYQQKLLAERLGNIELLNVFTTEEENIVKEAKANAEFISQLLPYMIVMLLFAGAMSIGVDAIAGEKERGTLASMLISPVKRSDIVWGKLFSLMILTGISSIIYSGSMIVAMPMMAQMNGEGMGSMFGGVSFGIVQVIELVAIMLALVFLFVSVIALLATYAKDTKTAQTYVSPCYIVVIVAGMLTMFSAGGEIAIEKYAIPIYGNALVIRDICTSEVVLEKFGASLIGTLLIGIICVVAMIKAFNSEKIMFNA